MCHTDARVKATADIIRTMKAVKLNAWEGPLEVPPHPLSPRPSLSSDPTPLRIHMRVTDCKNQVPTNLLQPTQPHQLPRTQQVTKVYLGLLSWGCSPAQCAVVWE